jgi:hypothetical protein
LLLLKRSQDAEAEMRWAEERLFDENLWHGNPPSNRKDLAGWTEIVIAANPDLVDSLFYCQCRGSEPEYANSFEQPVLSLVTSEGGL